MTHHPARRAGLLIPAQRGKPAQRPDALLTVAGRQGPAGTGVPRRVVPAGLLRAGPDGFRRLAARRPQAAAAGAGTPAPAAG
ncbi:hypothetical protein V1J52_01515 [Streptomyces sp. TRM 70351]|uniref:hypothetical protein n=1 Tax=Streptomyces sp. TRM 70351 TaxID=3116552 RepID=UPI002E7C0354|nr:hypothetical protein [Streptomyces sp. TRM 70351]MEE1926872.1 hypothetical protein [Streptomyces sp. TRM 70351]